MLNRSGDDLGNLDVLEDHMLGTLVAAPRVA